MTSHLARRGADAARTRRGAPRACSSGSRRRASRSGTSTTASSSPSTWTATRSRPCARGSPPRPSNRSRPAGRTRWRAFHRPVEVAGIWIGPAVGARPRSGARAVVIDPGRAFGTGAHPTTRLCVELLAGLGRRGSPARRRLRLGRPRDRRRAPRLPPVTCVDVDPVAVETTAANAAANGVELDAQLADALAGRSPQPTWLSRTSAPSGGGDPRSTRRATWRSRPATSRRAARPHRVAAGETVVLDGWAADASSAARPPRPDARPTRTRASKLLNPHGDVLRRDFSGARSRSPTPSRSASDSSRTATSRSTTEARSRSSTRAA